MMTESEKRRTYTVMSKLTDYLFEKVHIDNDEKETIKRRITFCRSVNGEKIVNALHQLHEEGYWRSLEEAVAAAEGEEEENQSNKDNSDQLAEKSSAL
mmetsp:Transcript_23275/g.42196  ORF Transcript_23275/g.42196 Transcript_23275/m.42196 type:complete len:98 (-) Transcript_23275:64-357(-)